jgi:hypothetical protein
MNNIRTTGLIMTLGVAKMEPFDVFIKNIIVILKDSPSTTVP